MPGQDATWLFKVGDDKVAVESVAEVQRLPCEEGADVSNSACTGAELAETPHILQKGMLTCTVHS